MAENNVYGHEMKKHFMLDPDYVNVNNGSCGTESLAVYNKHVQLLKEAQSKPDFMCNAYMPMYMEATRNEVAKLIGADSSNIVFCNSATDGISTVLLTFPWEQNDEILMLNVAYPTCTYAADFAKNQHNLRLDVIDVGVEIDEDLFLKEVEQRFLQSKPRAFICDILSSMPVILFPWEKVVKLCKKYNIVSIIDGAHAIGHIPMNLANVDPDFLFTNAHKWLNSPAACTVLYVSAKNHNLIEALPLSYGYGLREKESIAADTLTNRFVNSFKQDLPKFIAVGEAIKFRKSIGGEEKIQQYCHEIALKGAEIISKELGTSFIKPPYPVAMVNVEVPLRNIPSIETQKVFWPKYNTFLRFMEFKGKFYTRLSGAVYLEESDFYYIAKVIKDFCSL
ncbi:Hercynylcysteine sulfoxide lyase [Schizosaccharomyces pombe]